MAERRGCTAAAPAVLLGSDDGELSAQRDAPVGGQAVLEGVMMRGVANWAVAVRKPSAEQLDEGEQEADGESIPAPLGEIEVTTYPLDSAMKRHSSCDCRSCAASSRSAARW